MKKIFFLLLFCLCTIYISAQLSIKGNYQLIGKKIGKDSVTVILFDTIDSKTEIGYAGTNVRFYKYADANSNTNPIYPSLSPDDATGYIIKVDDVPADTIWVIDYNKYLPNLMSIEPDAQSTDPCNELDLLINASIPKLIYTTFSGNFLRTSTKFHR